VTQRASRDAALVACNLRGAASVLRQRAAVHAAVGSSATVGFTPAEVDEIALQLSRNAETIEALAGTLDRTFVLVEDQARTISAIAGVIPTPTLQPVDNVRKRKKLFGLF
jgi:hypothetical protein